MTRRVVWTQRAQDDLQTIGEYIATDDPDAAERWVTGLIRAVERLTRFAMSGRSVPERAREDVREVIKGSYRIVYRVQVDRIEVLTVLEGHHQLPEDVADD